jgi:hypothetical protein
MAFPIPRLEFQQNWKVDKQSCLVLDSHILLGPRTNGELRNTAVPARNSPSDVCAFTVMIQGWAISTGGKAWIGCDDALRLIATVSE